MNFRVSSKTRVVQSLLNTQQMVESYTEYVENEKTALGISRDHPLFDLEKVYIEDITTLKAYKLNFNNILKSIKPYEVQ